jgi:C-terminal processing protease CtpA/Prc
VGRHTVSAAESLSIMLVDSGRVTVVGRQSAATSGDITGSELTGSFGFTFTGMEILHAYAGQSVFHGVGIVPEVEVPLTAADLRDGVDQKLVAAIGALLAGSP